MNKEDDLLKLLDSGSEDAMKQIFELYYVGLCTYVKSIVRDHQAAEEIVEDIFIHAWVNAKTLHIKTSLRNYFFRSAHNNSLKYLSKKKTEKKYQGNYIYEDNEILNTGSPDHPFEGMVTRELEEMAEKVLNSLPEKCREIYFLNRFENLSYQEIADKLEITVGTVKTQMSRAFQKFREELKDYILLIIFILLSK